MEEDEEYSVMIKMVMRVIWEEKDVMKQRAIVIFQKQKEKKRKEEKLQAFF